MEDIVNVDLAHCTSAEAAILLSSELSQIVSQVIGPIAQARDPARTGGWFAFWRGDPSGVIITPVIGLPAGLVSPERFQKYSWFATEKAVRLGRHQEHISSFQSRDESDPDRMQHKYGGAIACGIELPTRLIFSFSGFSEHEDEAVCAILAMRHRLLTDKSLRDICSVSENPVLRRFLDQEGDLPW